MDNRIGTTPAEVPPPSLTPARSAAWPAQLIPPSGEVLPAEPPTLDTLPTDLKERVARLSGLNANKALRLTNRSFRKAGAEALTRLEIAAKDLCTLPALLEGLPRVQTIAITGFRYDPVAQLAELAALSPAVRQKIVSVDLRHKCLTDAGMVYLKEFPRLQTLTISGNFEITDAGLAHIKDLTQLQTLDLSSCPNFTDDGLALLKTLPQLTLPRFHVQQEI